MTILVLSGVFGNFLSSMIFLRQRNVASFNYYLICMACWDSALLLSSFFQFSVWTIRDPQGRLNTIGPHAPVLKVAFVLINTALSGCVWVITCVTIERYRAISSPLLHMAHDNVLRAKKILMIVSLGAVLFNIPRNFEVSVGQVCSCTDNKTVALTTAMLPTELNENLVYYILYRVVGGCGFVFSLPCAILIVLTVRMCVVIHQAGLQRGKYTLDSGAGQSRRRKSADSNATNRTLVIIVVKFLLCYSLITVLDVIQVALQSQVFHQSSTIEKLSMISNNFVVLNSSTNFLIYYIGGKNFRAELARLLRIKPKTQKSSISVEKSVAASLAPKKRDIEENPLVTLINGKSEIVFVETSAEIFL